MRGFVNITCHRDYTEPAPLVTVYDQCAGGSNFMLGNWKPPQLLHHPRALGVAAGVYEAVICAVPATDAVATGEFKYYNFIVRLHSLPRFAETIGLGHVAQ